MSIFKSSFSPTVQKQLEARQKAINNRIPQNLSYFNSRNAWIRLSSSVNVDGKNDLAKNYVLQGGTLNNITDKSIIGKPKSGVGEFNNAYSNKSYQGTSYRLGIRPMPGITSVDIKSKTAYGSLREAVVNFQCWDIKQLEDLELLYMRPGYTVLLEWGWAPYLNNKGEYKPTFTDYYDIINTTSKDRTKLFKELYDKSVKHGGNYDAMFGYVKNYQWSARMDGGYDCQTTIITTGEIIESLKINYSLPQEVTVSTRLLKDEFTPVSSTDWVTAYEKNILAGIWAELYHSYSDVTSDFTSFSASALVDADSILGISDFWLNLPEGSLSGNGNQLYITLEVMFNILNKYIIAKGSDGQPLVKLSVKQNEYDGTSTAGKELLCTAHPLQISVDPSICVIPNKVWYNNNVSSILTPAITAAASSPTVLTAKAAYDLLIKGATGKGTIETDIEDGILKITDITIYEQVERLLKEPTNPLSQYSTIEGLLNGEFGSKDSDSMYKIKTHLESIPPINSFKVTFRTTIKNELKSIDIDTFISNGITAGQQGYGTTQTFTPALIDDQAVSDIVITVPPAPASTVAATATIANQGQQAITNLEFTTFFKKQYFLNGDPYTEIGIIKNIYVNVNYLYLKALDTSLQSSDPSNKNEINLYNYLKKIISDIQASIGNVSSFEIHVDPVDNNVARIIDVNYTEEDNNTNTYNNLYPLQVHNLSSVVRSYSLQSQIFPNQSALIAIGSQAQGGQLGMQNNTMIDFNRKITDRIIPEKKDGINSPTPSINNGIPTITNGLGIIVKEFSSLTSGSAVHFEQEAKTSLHDLIAYFQTIVKSPGSNRNLIPTKFSCEMDGIGGLVIGHMFKLPDEIMPSGYRGINGIGSKLGNTITSIGHTISNGDWVTKIDTLNIVLDDPSNKTLFTSLLLGTLFAKAIANAINPTIRNSSTPRPTDAARIAGFGKVDPSVPKSVAALLDMAAYTEGTSGQGSNNGYDIIVEGQFGRNTVPNWNENYTGLHPKLLIQVRPDLQSTAAGRYQFLEGAGRNYWSATLGSDLAFNKKNQDTAGWYIIKQKPIQNSVIEDSYNVAKSGVTDVYNNASFIQLLGVAQQTATGQRFNKGLGGIWASLPDKNGNPTYGGQSGGYTAQEVYNIYLKAVEKYK